MHVSVTRRVAFYFFFYFCDVARLCERVLDVVDSLFGFCGISRKRDLEFKTSSLRKCP